MLVALGLRGEPVAVVPIVLMGVTVAVEAAMMYRFLAALTTGVTVNDVLGRQADRPKVAQPC